MKYFHVLRPKLSTIVSGKRRISAASALLIYLTSAAVPFNTAKASTSDGCQFAGTCLASIQADLDGDGKIDSAEMVYDERKKVFDVVINTADGDFYRPLSGPIDWKSKTPPMWVRTGSGDLRCRGWTDGTVCGYPTLSDAPSTALYVTSTRGDFIIYITAPISVHLDKASGTNRVRAYTVVVQALEGRAVKETVRG